MTVDECRKLAASYRNQAKQPGISSKMAGVLENIARSFTGLASQFELLLALDKNERR